MSASSSGLPDPGLASLDHLLPQRHGRVWVALHVDVIFIDIPAPIRRTLDRCCRICRVMPVKTPDIVS